MGYDTVEVILVVTRRSRVMLHTNEDLYKIESN